MTDKAVVLAAGSGTRMQRGPVPPELTAAQRDMAARGLKALVPLGRHPFLGYLLNGLADAGFRRICLVLSPGQGEVLEYLHSAAPARLSVEHAVQERPLGTAHTVLRAEGFAATDSVVMVNGDNLYPTSGLAALRQRSRAGLLGFRRSILVRQGNIPAERITAFALIATDPQGNLTRIVEKPAEREAAGFGADPLVSMNAWLLPPTIYTACRAIGPSHRGELELQDAVRHAIEHLGESFEVVECAEGVLDLSTAADIPEVERRLRGVSVRL